LNWYDGRLLPAATLELSIHEPGLLYGATVFSTLRVYSQSLDHPLTHWQAHCARLDHSLQTLGWQQPNWEQVRQGAEALRSQFPVLRITLFPDGREWIIGRELPSDLSVRQQQGIIAWLATPEPELEWQRSLAAHKTGNYLSAWLAGQRAQQLGAQEAILVDASGNWLETTTGNLWGWGQGQWWTPPTEAGILPGIVRQQLITALARHNKKVGAIPWHPDWVTQLEAIAYSNCVVELVPIRVVFSQDTVHTYAADHAAWQELRQLFDPVTAQSFTP
jgi:4-amino-4-deoxychorismate lyase